MISLTYPKTVLGDTAGSGSSTPSSTHYGIFTTDTGASRCIKVCAIYDDADVPGKVKATMKVCYPKPLSHRPYHCISVLWYVHICKGHWLIRIFTRLWKPMGSSILDVNVSTPKVTKSIFDSLTSKRRMPYTMPSDWNTKHSLLNT